MHVSVVEIDDIGEVIVRLGQKALFSEEVIPRLRGFKSSDVQNTFIDHGQGKLCRASIGSLNLYRELLFRPHCLWGVNLEGELRALAYYIKRHHPYTLRGGHCPFGQRAGRPLPIDTRWDAPFVHRNGESGFCTSQLLPALVEDLPFFSRVINARPWAGVFKVTRLSHRIV